MRLALVALPVAALLVCSEAGAAVRTVGLGKTFPDPCAAVAAAGAGDVIEIDASQTYTTSCAWTTEDLTLRGVGGRPKIDVTGKALAQGKGALVVLAAKATVENLEISGARLAGDKNGAAIRHQGQDLVVRGCYFHDNDDGILGSPLPISGIGSVTVDQTELADNGAGDGQSHNLYLGGYARFTMTRSWSHRSVVGHLVKSRALVNVIAWNRLTQEGGSGSYEIDLPNGGESYVVGNWIQQGNATGNPSIIAFGQEGATNAGSRLVVVNNTFVDDRAGGGTFVFVNASATTASRIQNNLFVGPGTVTNQGSAELVTNLGDADGDAKLVDRAGFDYRLATGSIAVDRGTAPPPLGASLSLDRQYVHPLSAEGRTVAGAGIDVGAFELGGGGGLVDGGAPTGAGGGEGGPGGGGGGGPPDGGGSATDAAGAAPGEGAADSGCGCRLARPGLEGSGVALGLALVGAALARRRAVSPARAASSTPRRP